MFTLIKQAKVFAPQQQGVKDILIGAGTILKVAGNIDPGPLDPEVIQAEGMNLLPGIVDPHVHITGGGGEAGFRTRARELRSWDLLKGGVTTVLGLLGTDATTRSVENLLAKAKGLREEGLSAYILTGAYEYPTPNISGSVKRDMVFIEEVIGAKIALSDHRSSVVTVEELSRLAADVRTGGMIGGKGGLVVIHMGSGKTGLDPILEVLERTDIPPRHLLPTHVNRSPDLLNQALKFLGRGGSIDLTTGLGEITPAEVVLRAKAEGLDTSRITISSDGNGSFPQFDAMGKLVNIAISPVNTLLLEFQKMVREMDFPPEEAAQLVTENAAKSLGLYPKKACVREGSEADLLLLDKNWNLQSVFARGTLMMREGEITAPKSF